MLIKSRAGKLSLFSIYLSPITRRPAFCRMAGVVAEFTEHLHKGGEFGGEIGAVVGCLFQLPGIPSRKNACA